MSEFTKEEAADIYLHTGQIPQSACVGCGRGFGEEAEDRAQRCAQDVIHCVECRARYDEKTKALKGKELVQKGSTKMVQAVSLRDYDNVVAYAKWLESSYRYLAEEPKTVQE